MALRPHLAAGLPLSTPSWIGRALRRLLSRSKPRLRDTLRQVLPLEPPAERPRESGCDVSMSSSDTPSAGWLRPRQAGVRSKRVLGNSKDRDIGASNPSTTGCWPYSPMPLNALAVPERYGEQPARPAGALYHGIPWTWDTRFSGEAKRRACRERWCDARHAATLAAERPSRRRPVGR
jgi:hypothetical protein